MSVGGNQMSCAGNGVSRHRDLMSVGRDQMSRDSNEVHSHYDPMPTYRYAVSPLFRGPDEGRLAGDRLTRLRVQAKHGKPAAGITVPYRGNPLSHDRGLPGHGKDIEVGTGAQAIPDLSTAAALLRFKGRWGVGR